MMFAGVDIGSGSTEAVLFDGQQILASTVMPSKPNPLQSASLAMDKVLAEIGSLAGDITGCISTGYGREKIDFAEDNISEISCIGKGVNWLNPKIRTIIDIGAQDSKVIRLKDDGSIDDFVMNDKCAAGTGRSLEVIARTFGLSINELSALAASGAIPAPIQNVCSIYANFDALGLLSNGWTRENIAYGVSDVLVKRLVFRSSRIEIDAPMCVTGGVAKNRGVIRCLEDFVKISVTQLSVDVQIVGALGAALFAMERYKKRNSTALSERKNGMQAKL